MQAEDGIRYLVRSRGLGDVYKRQEGGLDLLTIFKGHSAVDLQEAVTSGEAVGGQEVVLSLIHI